MNWEAIAEETLEIIKEQQARQPTLRDKVAMLALAAEYQLRPASPGTVNLLADQCYEIADAMLKARKKVRPA